jgi:IS30 family transposase
VLTAASAASKPNERNLAELGENELEDVATIINATPRRCLGYYTPKEIFDTQVASLATSA